MSFKEKLGNKYYLYVPYSAKNISNINIVKQFEIGFFIITTFTHIYFPILIL